MPPPYETEKNVSYINGAMDCYVTIVVRNYAKRTFVAVLLKIWLVSITTFPPEMYIPPP